MWDVVVVADEVGLEAEVPSIERSDRSPTKGSLLVSFLDGLYGGVMKWSRMSMMISSDMMIGIAEMSLFAVGLLGVGGGIVLAGVWVYVHHHHVLVTPKCYVWAGSAPASQALDDDEDDGRVCLQAFVWFVGSGRIADDDELKTIPLDSAVTPVA
jgi:hypothetical protein